MSKIIIHTPQLDSAKQEVLFNAIPGELIQRQKYCLLNNNNESLPNNELLKQLREELGIDINLVPDSFDPQQAALLITDMDSTLISIECVDEIADFLNIKDKVAEITESAMRGEIDFNTSLKKRVKLLKGLEFTVLDRVYNERLTLNPGAEQLIAGLQQRGVKTALVSGGFTFFTDRLKQRLMLDYTISNKLEVEENKLTGEVLGEVVNGEVKRRFLEQLMEELTITPSQVIAVGDGANDLPMLKVSGMGVAYHAKPIVQQQTDVVLNHSGLDAILDFLDAGELN